MLYWPARSPFSRSSRFPGGVPGAVVLQAAGVGLQQQVDGPVEFGGGDAAAGKGTVLVMVRVAPYFRFFTTDGKPIRQWGDKDLFTGEASPKQLMGPVGIAQLSGESAQAGWIALLSLMASISLNLGLLNLMPIPVLDGGHIFIMAIETISRRDFSLAVKEKMLFVGFVLLMTLMVTVIYNDLTRITWIENLMPWR